MNDLAISNQDCQSDFYWFRDALFVNKVLVKMNIPGVAQTTFTLLIWVFVIISCT